MVEKLCERAAQPFSNDLIVKLQGHHLHTAAVCIYPNRVKAAVNAIAKLEKTNFIQVASGI